jgi:hypothetical protein
VAGYRLVFFDYLIAHDGANGKRAIYPVTAIPEPAGMPDRGPHVSQIPRYVDESGFLERVGRRTVPHAAFMSRLERIDTAMPQVLHGHDRFRQGAALGVTMA